MYLYKVPITWISSSLLVDTYSLITDKNVGEVHV